MPAAKNPETKWIVMSAFLGGVIVGMCIGFGLGHAGGGSVATAPAAVVSDDQREARAEYLATMADDDPFLGDEDAPVTIVEFSDLQCPFCRRHALQTLPQIRENYIDTGKVKYVYRDFSTDNENYHPGGYLAAQAVECAADQDRYWQLWDVVMLKQEEMAPGRTAQFGRNEVLAWATEVDGLDVDALTACVDSGEKRAEIDADTIAGANYGVTGTPSVFVQGVPLSGAQPYQVFAAAIDRALAGIE